MSEEKRRREKLARFSFDLNRKKGQLHSYTDPEEHVASTIDDDDFCKAELLDLIRFEVDSYPRLKKWELFFPTTLHSQRSLLAQPEIN